VTRSTAGASERKKHLRALAARERKLDRERQRRQKRANGTRPMDAVDEQVALRLAARRQQEAAAEAAIVKAEVEAEAREQARLEAATVEVARARAAAADLRAQAEQLGIETRDLLRQLAGKIVRIEEVAAGLDRAVHVVDWHARNSPGATNGPAVNPVLPLGSPPLAPPAFKVARALAKVTGAEPGMADIRAAQASWEVLL
jgi:hypothetical protein